MMELRRRYQSLYIPSDFFDAVFTWVDAFPLTRPFLFSNACNFHILHKEVDPLVKNTAVLDPPDANHTYSAKVGSSLIKRNIHTLWHLQCAIRNCRCCLESSHVFLSYKCLQEAIQKLY